MTTTYGEQTTPGSPPGSGVATTTGTGAGTHASGPDPRRWLALGVIAIAQLMVVLDASIVNIALPVESTVVVCEAVTT